ncbi:MAG TPA: transposase [Hyphomicrobiaceae bacterium]|nr:transposase [Hyphomicrobiaceae bacterium]
MTRGADHRDIFEHDIDCEVFLDALAEAAKRSALEVHAYCLMTNHFHLLVRSLEGKLSAGMQFLSGRFTRMTNLRVGRDGPLFRGRYASVLITSDAQLIQTCRYIHLNPVAARTTTSAEHWRWSSAAAYLGKGDSPSWLKTEMILELFGPGDRAGAYQDFMAIGNDRETTEFYAGMGW